MLTCRCALDSSGQLCTECLHGSPLQDENLPARCSCLTLTCDKWENGKPMSSIDTGSASIEHGTKTDSDLARPSLAAVTIQPRSKLARVLSAGARPQSMHTQVPITQSETHCCPRMLPLRLHWDRGGPGRRRTRPDQLEDLGRRP